MVVNFLFQVLFFVLPFVFLPFTSELFEFNKIIVVYIITALILANWAVEIIKNKKIIFHKTLLDVPLLLFILSQILSTIFSIDFYTSFFGYYSRFNGGLISSLCFAFLYWAFVTHMNTTSVRKLLKTILVSTTCVSIWAIMEHFGGSISCALITGTLDTNCWVQDVKNRVFATLGQPNWLAAYLVAVIPFTWALFLSSNSKVKKQYFWLLISSGLFLALLFTKSKSGLLGFLSTYTIFWILAGIKKYARQFLVMSSIFIVLALPTINSIINPIKDSDMKDNFQTVQMGGTDSGILRQIVWKGAIDIWRNSPIFGTGVETFAYSYYQFRPAEHNLTSEWDFLYNKAHNEYLNIAATSGTIGILTYMLIILSFVFVSLKKMVMKHDKSTGLEQNIILTRIAIISGFVSLLVTNFFGFSVVVTSLLFFIFPALFETVAREKKKTTNNKLDIKQKLLLAGVIGVTSYLLFTTINYWRADYFYAKGKNANFSGNLSQSWQYLSKAIKINPNVASYYDALSYTYTQSAITLWQDKKQKETDLFVKTAIETNQKAVEISPRNVALAKSYANNLLDLSQIDKKYLLTSTEVLKKLTPFAPTDPSIPYRLGLIYATMGQTSDALKYFQTALKLKPDYKNAELMKNEILKSVSKNAQ